jgi:hypothetical protein
VFGNAALWSKAAADIATMTGSVSGSDLQITIAIALGLVSLAPLFGGSIAAEDEKTARRSGATGVLWLMLGAFLVTATVAGSALTFGATASGQMPKDLPASILTASGRGEIAICGTHASDPAALTFACAAKASPGLPLRLNDFKVSGDYLLKSLPALQGSEPTLARLAAVFMIVLGMGIAASGVQFIVTSLGHDILHPKRRRRGPITRRLAVARLSAAGLVVLASLWLAGHSVDARRLFVLALMFSAALVTPLLALALMPRVRSMSAFAAFCVAGFVTAHFMLVDAARMSPGELASNAIFAALDGLAVGLFVSFLQRAPSARVESPERKEEAQNQ